MYSGSRLSVLSTEYQVPSTRSIVLGVLGGGKNPHFWQSRPEVGHPTSMDCSRLEDQRHCFSEENSYELFGDDGLSDVWVGSSDGSFVGDGGVGDDRRALSTTDYWNHAIRRAIEDAAGAEYRAVEFSAAGDGGSEFDTDCVAAGALRDSAARRVAISGIEFGICTGVRAAGDVDDDRSDDDRYLE